ncbi:opacity protein and surface antigen-like protein [Sphingomonas sp. LH128]|uniref:outer membrane protein n=1 Tax=Sphingomonas sp. LH128 TaxID=473781 RepID=UPI00027CA45D|nr:porin family protein [Sphingomonas sp. LH128]EJU10041.1 opacity protein and surface antigen-like protein [Sphingomonas sp. LH128]
MKKFVPVAVAAALFAVPAAAQAQAFVQVETGLDSISVGGESDEGVAYGISAGYDIPLSNGLFVGIQGTAADSTTKECASAGAERLCIKTGRDLAAVVRLGTQVGERSKIYVLGGYTNARLRVTYTDGIDSYGEGANSDGFRLGAGAQYDLSDRLFVKAEYRYSNYESDFSRHNALVALGAKF